MYQRRRFDNPQGPFRVWNAKDVEVGIFPNYRAATAMMLTGDRLQSISQEEYDHEMAKPWPSPVPSGDAAPLD